jgi:TDG/mug DNA glycosylase family protein
MPRPVRSPVAAPGWRPTPDDLRRAAGARLEDVIAPGLRVLFCGINPGLYSAATGFHFARPGNRFWRALWAGGFTDRVLSPSEQRALLDVGCGITNLVPRATAAADELSRDELIAGGRVLAGKVRRYRPRWLAVLGLGAYRVAFGRRDARVGPQAESLSRSRVWILPNPSGLNAHYRPAELAAEFRRLKEAAE